MWQKEGKGVNTSSELQRRKKKKGRCCCCCCCCFVWWLMGSPGETHHQHYAPTPSPYTNQSILVVITISSFSYFICYPAVTLLLIFDATKRGWSRICRKQTMQHASTSHAHTSVIYTHTHFAFIDHHCMMMMKIAMSHIMSMVVVARVLVYYVGLWWHAKP